MGSKTIRGRHNIRTKRNMKKLIIITMILPILATAQRSDIGWLFISENTITLDKQAHFVGGIWGGSVGYIVAYGENGNKRGNAKLWGVVTATLLGTLKEVSDIKTTGFDTSDLAYTVAGGIVGTYTFDFLVQRAKKRKEKRDNIIVMTDNFYQQ